MPGCLLELLAVTGDRVFAGVGVGVGVGVAIGDNAQLGG